MEEQDVLLHAFLISAIDGVYWSASSPRTHVTPVGKAGAPFTGWAGPKTNMAAGVKNQICSALLDMLIIQKVTVKFTLELATKAKRGVDV